MDGDHDVFDHTPVMVDRVTALFGTVPPGTIVDATLGGAGHALALLLAHPHLRLLGLDQDADALAAAEVTLAPVADRVTVRCTRFDHLAEVVAETDVDPVTGALFDLGVSSPQLDRPERGFSYRHEGPLDMRMDPRTSTTADEIVNTWTVADITATLRRYADERYAGRIARAIVAARPLTSTTQLAEVVRDAIPAPARRRGGHPAKRTFQALRIAVNAELDILPGAIDAAIDVLAPGGRIVVLAYHSGEDRIVKERLHTAASGGCACPPSLPCTCGAVPRLALLKAGAWKADAVEAEQNPRASSARLRAAEKLAVDEAAA